MSELVVTDVEKIIETYKSQYEDVQKQLQTLEQNYRENSAKGVAVLNQIAGAIAALEQLSQPKGETPAPAETPAPSVETLVVE